MRSSLPFTFLVSHVSYSSTLSTSDWLTSMALDDLTPLTLFLMMIISEVTPVPPNVFLFSRNAPMKSDLPSFTTQLRNFWELSSVPLEDMNIPIPPSRSFLTFLAMQKSWIFLNFLDRSLSPVSSMTCCPVTKGTLVIARSTLPFSTLVFSKPFISTLASGYNNDRILPVVWSISTACISL